MSFQKALWESNLFLKKQEEEEEEEQEEERRRRKKMKKEEEGFLKHTLNVLVLGTTHNNFCPYLTFLLPNC